MTLSDYKIVQGILRLALMFVTLPAWSQDLPAKNDKTSIQFSRDIKPVLDASCIKCHARGRAMGGLSLDNREALLKGGKSGSAIIPGNSSKSLLVDLVSSQDPDRLMPKRGTRLTPREIGLLSAWINQGAAWDSDVSFSKPPPRNLTPRRPELPQGEPSDNPVDRFIRKHLQKESLGSPVTDRVFARRAYLDTVGMLPTETELNGFINNTHREKRGELVDRLLADKYRYAAHWLTFWNDHLRNDYQGTGYIDGGRKQISVWLHQALVSNMPFDRFVASLVDPKEENDGFVKGIVWRGAVNASQTPPMQAAQNIAQVFMGVNLKCASCHDSFINDWTLADAYGIASVYSDNSLEMYRCDRPLGKAAQAKFLYPQVGELDPTAKQSDKRRRLAELLTSSQNGRLSRTIVNRLWAKFMGRGLVEPLDDMEQAAWNPDLLDWLSEDLVENGYDLKRTIKIILTSKTYQMPSISLDEGSSEQFVFRGPLVRRMTAEQFRDALSSLIGIWRTPPAAKFIFEPSVTNQIGKIRASMTSADPLTTALGRPNREQVVTARPQVATTLQALEMTNGETLSRLLSQGAERMLKEEKSSPEELVKLLYLRGLSRKPQSSELALAVDLLRQDKQANLEDFLWSFSMLPEFQLIY